MSALDELGSWGDRPAIEVTIDQALEQSLANVQALRNALETAEPNIAAYLDMINTQLRQYPELVHLIPEEEKGVIVGAMLAGRLAYLDAKSKPKPKKAAASAQLAEGGIVADLL